MSGADEENDQSEVLSFLGDSRTFGARGPLRRIDTHGAIVFLVGEDAYKVKRSVRFPFMDFSTLEKRRAACEAEIEVNKPNAPDIYIGVIPIRRNKGGLFLNGEGGEIVEWAVHMRRFDDNATLDKQIEQRALEPEFLARLADAVLRSHERAPLRDGADAVAELERYVSQNASAFAEDPVTFSSKHTKIITEATRSVLEKVKPLLIARSEAGYVRRCHGDLHLRNIAIIAGEPVLFDAVEFDDQIASCDILYDLAFLLMDLIEQGQRRAANLLLNRYLWKSDDAQIEGLAALPVFLSIRAAIKAKVVAASLPYLDAAARPKSIREARRYFCLAESFLKPGRCSIVAIGGLSGTGKSALAAELAPLIGRSPGAVWLRSDIERKRLFGVREFERLSSSAYSRDANTKVYALLREKARLAILSGQSVILDAVHGDASERADAAQLAFELGAPFTGLWLEAVRDVRLLRVRDRTKDASDADVSVAASQIGPPRLEAPWNRLDASASLPDVVWAARAILDV